MDLLKLAAKIELDDSSYTKGIADAEKAGKSLAGKMGAMTVAVGNIAADMIKKGVSAINQVIGGAIDSYADYQQLIGGVETLFKGSSKRVAEYAQQSFKTTGLSANEYMETVTSFSASLLQGLKGDTNQAADLANMAVTDMADNANKMGTNISAIQNAYQGFAKQNYTMLDNLKLGYGGTREEMVRLINDSGILDKEIKNLDNVSFDQIVRAIHKIQEQMEISGTTAKEAASTISGSKASLKAAWEDMLSAIGGEGGQERMDQTLENFKTSFSTYMTNFIPTLTTTIVNSGSLVEAIADAISDIPTDLLTKLGTGALESGTQIVGGLKKISTWVIDSITDMFKAASADSTQIEEFGKAIGDFIGTAISDIAVNAPAIATGIFDAGVALAGGLVKGLFSGLFGEESEVDEITKGLSDSLTSIDYSSTKAGAILNYMDSLIAKYGDAQKAMESSEWQTAAEELEKVLEGSGEVFIQYGDDVEGAIKKLKEMNDELRKTAIINAITKATQEETELLATQTLEFNRAKGRYDLYASAKADYTAPLRNALTELATRKQASIDRRLAAGEYVGSDEIERVSGILNGFVDLGKGLQSLESLDLSQMNSLIHDFFAGGLIPEEYRFDEYIEKTQPLVDEANTKMSQAADDMKKWHGEIQATEEAISETNQAMEKTMKDLLGTGAEVKETVKGGGDEVAAALQTVADEIASIKIPKIFSFFMPQKKAIGLDYVPYNGYVAELHEGEAILTKRQNQERKNGMSAQEMATVMEDALVTAMERVTVYMSGQKVGDLTTRRVKNNINSESSSRQRAMGG